MFIREGDAGDPPSADPCVFMAVQFCKTKSYELPREQRRQHTERASEFCMLGWSILKIIPDWTCGQSSRHFDLGQN